MKKAIALVISTVLLISAAGCGSSEIEASVEAFPEIVGTDMDGNSVTSDIFAENSATVVNFWNNGCGTCIAEMPELEELCKELAAENVGLIGVGADSGESDEKLAESKEILASKGVTYLNISPDIESDFYKEFIGDITGYPTTYIVDSEGNIIGAPIIGDVKKQEEKLRERLDLIKEDK